MNIKKNLNKLLSLLKAKILNQPMTEISCPNQFRKCVINQACFFNPIHAKPWSYHSVGYVYYIKLISNLKLKMLHIYHFLLWFCESCVPSLTAFLTAALFMPFLTSL